MTCRHDSELRIDSGSTCPPKHFNCVPRSEVLLHISYLFPAPAMHNICCLDIVHVVPESGFYVIFHSSCFDVPSPSVALFGILAPKLLQQQSQNLQAFYKWRSLQVHDQLFQAACCCCYFYCVVCNKSTEYVAWEWGYQVTCYCALSLIVVYSKSLVLATYCSTSSLAYSPPRDPVQKVCTNKTWSVNWLNCFCGEV